MCLRCVEKPFGSSDTHAALSKKYVQSVQTCGSQPRFLIRCSPNREQEQNCALFQSCRHASLERFVFVPELHSCISGACVGSRVAYMHLWSVLCSFQSCIPASLELSCFWAPPVGFSKAALFSNIRWRQRWVCPPPNSWFLQNLFVTEVLIVLFGSRVEAQVFPHKRVLRVTLRQRAFPPRLSSCRLASHPARARLHQSRKLLQILVPEEVILVRCGD